MNLGSLIKGKFSFNINTTHWRETQRWPFWFENEKFASITTIKTVPITSENAALLEPISLGVFATCVLV